MSALAQYMLLSWNIHNYSGLLQKYVLGISICELRAATYMEFVTTFFGLQKYYKMNKFRTFLLACRSASTCI